MKYEKWYWYCASLLLILLAVIIASKYENEMLALSLAGVLALLAVVSYCIGFAKSRKEKAGVKTMTGLLIISFVTLTPTGNILAESSTTVTTPVKQDVETQAVVKQFELLTKAGPEYSELTVTSFDGTKKLTFPTGSVKVDSEHMTLITPAGKFSIVMKSGQTEIILVGPDGTLYHPNVGLCQLMLGLVVATGVAYVGLKIYQCGKKAISNYLQKASNASIVYIPPLITNIASAGRHTMGPCLGMLKAQDGTAFTLSNMWDNTYIDEMPKGSVDVFGNSVSKEYLLEVTETNTFVITSNGYTPCALKISTNLVDWVSEKQVIVVWLGTDNSGGVNSVTTVTMTSCLQPYATNIIRLENGEIVESYTLDRPPWPTTTSQGYAGWFICK